MFLTETVYFLCRVKLENMGLGVLPASFKLGSWSLSLWVKQPGRSITHPLRLVLRLNKE